MFEEKINSIKETTEIVILPEMFATGFSMQPEQFAETMDGETVEWMKRIASNKKIAKLMASQFNYQSLRY
jgi:predicted amidohydrolase